jgi:hypothetical protein
MSAGDVVVFWILALACAGVFFFAYGVVEEIIRKARTPRKIAKPALRFATTPIIEPPPNADMPPAVRGYDTPELFWRDALIHIRYLESEVAKHERNTQAILAEMKKREQSE